MSKGDRVYFVQQGEDGPIKIGFANNLAGRLRGLQTANPYKLHLRLVLHGNRKTEQKFHERFNADRLKGEWFRPSHDLLAFITTSNAERLVVVRAAAVMARDDVEASADMLLALPSPV